MKLLLIFLSGCLFSASSNAQQKVELKDIGKHMGDSVQVCGKIYGGKYLESASNQPTFLNMGAAYPNQPLTLVIWGATRKKLSFIPEKKLEHKNICVRGKLDVFKGKPQIVIKDEIQITIIE